MQLPSIGTLMICRLSPAQTDSSLAISDTCFWLPVPISSDLPALRNNNKIKRQATYMYQQQQQLGLLIHFSVLALKH